MLSKIAAFNPHSTDLIAHQNQQAKCLEAAVIHVLPLSLADRRKKDNDDAILSSFSAAETNCCR
jgi:hypothetical protein